MHSFIEDNGNKRVGKHHEIYLSDIRRAAPEKMEDNYPTTNVMNNRTDINDFNKIPNVGPATIRYLNIIGIKKPFELIGQNPYSMYGELCKITGKQFDPCLADVFISAVKFMEGAPPQKWWHYTEERKKRLTTPCSQIGRVARL